MYEDGFLFILVFENIFQMNCRSMGSHFFYTPHHRSERTASESIALLHETKQLVISHKAIKHFNHSCLTCQPATKRKIQPDFPTMTLAIRCFAKSFDPVPLHECSKHRSALHLDFNKAVQQVPAGRYLRTSNLIFTCPQRLAERKKKQAVESRWRSLC